MTGRRDRRIKATDVFAGKSFLLGQTDDFNRAFPEIEHLRVVLKEEGEGVSQYTQKRSFTREHPPGEYENCHNPRCYNGGIRIGELLRSMIMSGETELRRHTHCQGYEGSPKGRVKHAPCDNCFTVTISLTTKPQ